jgi:hypothetical protein
MYSIIGMRSPVHVGINSVTSVTVSEDRILGFWRRVVWKTCTDISDEFSAFKIRDPATSFFPPCRYYYHNTWRHNNVYIIRSENFKSDVIILVCLHSRRERIFKLCQFHQHVFFCRIQKISYVEKVYESDYIKWHQRTQRHALIYAVFNSLFSLFFRCQLPRKIQLSVKLWQTICCNQGNPT